MCSTVWVAVEVPMRCVCGLGLAFSLLCCYVHLFHSRVLEMHHNMLLKLTCVLNIVQH